MSLLNRRVASSVQQSKGLRRHCSADPGPTNPVSKGRTGRAPSLPRPWQLGTRVRVVALTRFVWFSALAFLGGSVTTGLAVATSEGDSPYAFLGQLARVLVTVENEYVEPVERDRLLEGSIRGMVGELDPHSAYLPPRDYTTFQSDTKGAFGGVGVEVDFKGNAVTVIAPIDDSPAQRAGIRSGDEIVAIDRAPVRGKSSTELVRRMRGKPGTTVTLSIRRRGNDKLLNFALVREIIEVASVASKNLDGKIAYVRIKQFQDRTHTELLEHIAELREAEPGALAGIILDLRNNPGGLVRSTRAVANEFLNGGLVYSTRHRQTTVSEVFADSGGALDSEPMVVLVNEFSASASELLAGALQDQGRATIVGANTFGKGSVQSIIDLPGGAGLRLTTMRYYTPKGRAIQAQGIQPDVLVEAAYAEDTTYGVLREKDLENHLPAEGAPGTGATDDSKQVNSDRLKQEAKQREDETGVSATHLGVAREIPRDPTGGPDFALSIGYQIVRDVLRRRR